MPDGFSQITVDIGNRSNITASLQVGQMITFQRIYLDNEQLLRGGTLKLKLPSHHVNIPFETFTCNCQKKEVVSSTFWVEFL